MISNHQPAGSKAALAPIYMILAMLMGALLLQVAVALGAA